MRLSNQLRAISGPDTLILRTERHPTAREISLRGISFSSYDKAYERADSFETLYEEIASDIVKRAKCGEDVTYAVPGSPFVAEKTVIILRDLAKKEHIPITVLPAMSFTEVLASRLGIDPIDGVLIMDASDLCKIPADWPTGIIVTQVYNRRVASESKLSLMEFLPDNYEIVLANHVGLPEEAIRRIQLYELDRQSDIDHLTSIYVPPVPRPSQFDFSPLVDVLRVLREPGGCPWDRVQTPKSLRKHILEEAYEVVEAIDKNDQGLLAEELGDLLLQIVFQANIAEEMNAFSMQDVIDGITKKMVRRHPHVFGDVKAKDVAAVLTNWEAIKKKEKPERKSVLDGIPRDLPALMAATKLQGKAANVGFDWSDASPVMEKCREEWRELMAAVEENDALHIEEELGDLLFAVVNASRFLHVDAELALLGANSKFRRRFCYIEEQVTKAGGEWKNFTLEELDAFWNEAKLNEKNENR